MGFQCRNGKAISTNKSYEEMRFGDINGDGFLDLLGITEKNNHPKLWLNKVK